jgi:hypothetical protein
VLAHQQKIIAFGKAMAKHEAPSVAEMPDRRIFALWNRSRRAMFPVKFSCIRNRRIWESQPTPL